MADELAPKVWAAATVVGVAGGLTGIAVTELLHLVQHLAFGSAGATFYDDVLHASAQRRVVAVTLAGALAGVGWLLLRRRTAPQSVERALADPDSRLRLGTSTADGCLQIVVVAMGASLGREGAPRQIAATIGARVANRLGVGAGDQRLLIAAGAGAGLAAVYNVPLAGALYAVELLLRSFDLRALLLCAWTSAVATATSWLMLPDRPVYSFGPVRLSPSLLVFAVLAGPVAGVAAWAFRGAAADARRRAPTGWRLPATTVAVFSCLGLISTAAPALLGNGRSASDLALTAHLGLAGAAVLLVLKPLATLACLRSGAVGGLLTPSLAIGALLGVCAGSLWNVLWPVGGVGACALVCAAAFVAVAQRAPLCAVALAIELTGSTAGLLLPLAGCVAAGRLAVAVLAARAAAPAAGAPEQRRAALRARGCR